MAGEKRIGGFVLAGGESSRMGRDKALLELGGVTLIARAANLCESVAGGCVIVGGARSNDGGGRFDGLTAQVIADDFPGAGPLGGIATALRVAAQDWNLVMACDLPYLTREWLEFLAERARRSEAEAVLPMNERGAEPLCAMYRKRAEAAIRTALESGTRKVTDGLSKIHTEFIEPSEWKAFDSEGLLFKNMNSPEDYEEARARFGGRQTR